MAGELRPILCVDFDGVIHSYASGWNGRLDVISDPPVPGALAWLERAQKLWDVQIYSSRSKDPHAVKAMKTWLLNAAMQKWNDDARAMNLVTRLTFSNEKPSADMTIDDKCTRFEGDWSDPALDPEALLEFKPWNKRRKAL